MRRNALLTAGFIGLVLAGWLLAICTTGVTHQVRAETLNDVSAARPSITATQNTTVTQPFDFVVAADMRQFAGPGQYDTPQYFRGAVEAIESSGNPAFLISPGDLDPPTNVRWTIDQYLGANSLWFPVVGNHEISPTDYMPYLRAYNYDPNGSAPPNIVQAGPPSCPETTFSFDYQNAHFVVLNEYCDMAGDDVTDGDVPDVLYNWLVDDLNATSQPHIFVFGHEPAFPQPDADNGRLRHYEDSLNAHPANRDRFWGLLKTKGVAAYICGHTHNYSAVLIDSVWQVDVGHARGLGDTGARSTFVSFHVNGESVTFDTYRDDANGGAYVRAHSDQLAGPSDEAHAVSVSGTLAYIGVGSRLFVIDIANPAHPKIAGQTAALFDVVNDVAVTGGYAYVADRSAGLRILDLAHPLAPVPIGSFGLTQPDGSIEDVAIAGPTAYLAGWNVGLDLINISTPVTPTLAGHFTLSATNSVALVGSMAYVADEWDGLRILNVANPAVPVEIGFYDMLGNAKDVAVRGSYAYVTGGYGGPSLYIIDISNPAAPQQAGFYPTPEEPLDVAVSGNYAYLADGSAGLRVIDISNPGAPSEVAAFPMFSAEDVDVIGTTAYVADGLPALHIIDVTNPRSPWEIGVADWFIPPVVTGIPASGGVLTSTSDNTVYVFPANTFTDTVIVTHTSRAPREMSVPGNLIGIDHFFETTAVYSSTGQPAQPTQPYTLTVQYTDQEKGPAIEGTLALYYWDGNQWVKEPSSTVNAANNTVTATPDHFSLWAVLGETYRVFLPTILMAH
jgi:hypothetical protein